MHYVNLLILLFLLYHITRYYHTYCTDSLKNQDFVGHLVLLYLFLFVLYKQHIQLKIQLICMRLLSQCIVVQKSSVEMIFILKPKK